MSHIFPGSVRLRSKRIVGQCFLLNTFHNRIGNSGILLVPFSHVIIFEIFGQIKCSFREVLH